MKKFTSTLSTDDLIRLAKETAKSETDIRHIDALMKAHVLSFQVPRDYSNPGTPNWNRQNLIEYIASKNGGTSPDQLLENIRFQASAPPKPTHAPPTSAPPAAPKRRIAVITQCAICQADTTIAEDALNEAEAKGLQVFCSEFCRDKAQRLAPAAVAQTKSIQEAFTTFMKEVPSFYPHATNVQMLGDECERRKLTSPSLDQLVEIYAEIRSRLPFKRLTEAEGRAMTSEQWAARAAKDPAMGGLNLDAVKEGLNRGELKVHSSNETRTFDLSPRGYNPQGKR